MAGSVDSDFVAEIADGQDFRKRIYSTQAAWENGLGLGAVVGILAILLVGGHPAIRTRRATCLGLFAGLALGIGCLVRLLSPVAELIAPYGQHYLRPDVSTAKQLVSAVEAMNFDSLLKLSKRSRDATLGAPGSITIPSLTAGTQVVRVVGPYGDEHSMELTPAQAKALRDAIDANRS